LRASLAAIGRPGARSAADRRHALGDALSCLFVAVSNLAEHKVRLVVALVGTAVPILLLVLQIAFLQGARFEVTRLYQDFRFDLALVPRSYEFLMSNGTLDRVRLSEAAALGPVAATYGLNVTPSYWLDKATQRRSSALLIGVDPAREFVADPDIRAGLEDLTSNGTVLVDDYANADFGNIAVGTDANLADRPVTVKGHYHLGLFLYADGSVIVRNSDFAQFARRDPGVISVGLVRLKPGSDPQAAKAELVKALPDDVRVLTHDELIAAEQGFFISTKPIGIMLWISMAIAFLVGAVILFQVLSTEMIARKKEFATFKAMGFSTGFVFGVGLLEAAVLSLGAFLPGLLSGAAILWVVQAMTHLPAGLTVSLVLEVLASVLGMSALAVIAVMRRIWRADPAELCR
jgi:putative ABC transport system permease protein